MEIMTNKQVTTIIRGLKEIKELFLKVQMGDNIENFIVIDTYINNNKKNKIILKNEYESILYISMDKNNLSFYTERSNSGMEVGNISVDIREHYLGYSTVCSFDGRSKKKIIISKRELFDLFYYMLRCKEHLYSYLEKNLMVLGNINYSLLFEK